MGGRDSPGDRKAVTTHAWLIMHPLISPTSKSYPSTCSLCRAFVGFQNTIQETSSMQNAFAATAINSDERWQSSQSHKEAVGSLINFTVIQT